MIINCKELLFTILLLLCSLTIWAERYNDVLIEDSQTIVLKDGQRDYGRFKIKVERNGNVAIDSLALWSGRSYNNFREPVPFQVFHLSDEEKFQSEYTLKCSPIYSEGAHCIAYYTKSVDEYGEEACFSKSPWFESGNYVDLNEDFISAYDSGYLNGNAINVILNPESLESNQEQVIDYGAILTVTYELNYYELGFPTRSVKLSASATNEIHAEQLPETRYTYIPYITVLDGLDEIDYYGVRRGFDMYSTSPEVKVINAEPGYLKLGIMFEGKYKFDKVTKAKLVVYDDPTQNSYTKECELDENLCAVFKGDVKTELSIKLFEYEVFVDFNSPFGVVNKRYYQRRSDWYRSDPLKFNNKAVEKYSTNAAILSAEINVHTDDPRTGFEWRRYDAPELVPSNKVACPVVGGLMSGRLNNLSVNTYYKYRPYYEAVDGSIYYGEWMAFGTADAYVYFEPMVSTYEPTAVTENSVILSGYALGGSDDITEQGFEYFPVNTSKIKKVKAEGERMTATLTDLLPGTTYNARAYVIDAKGITRGQTVEFTTAGEPQDAIEEVASAEEQPTFDVWTLQGVCVKRGTQDLSGLRPGLYIANGRKVLVR